TFTPPREENITIVLRNPGTRFVLHCALVVESGLLLSNQAWPAQSPVQDPAANLKSTGDPTDFWSNRGRWTFGLQLGFALENDIPHNISHIAILMAQPSVGLTLFDFHTPKFPVGRFSIVSEG